MIQKQGYTCVLFEAGVSIGNADVIEVSVAWERTNGQMIYTSAQYSYANIVAGTEMYFHNTSPFYDIARTQVSIRKYKKGVTIASTSKWVANFPALIVYDGTWLWLATSLDSRGE